MFFIAKDNFDMIKKENAKLIKKLKSAYEQSKMLRCENCKEFFRCTDCFSHHCTDPKGVCSKALKKKDKAKQK